MSRIIKTIYNKMQNDYITTKRRMNREAWYEVDGKSYLLHVVAFLTLFLLTTLGN